MTIDTLLAVLAILSLAAVVVLAALSGASFERAHRATAPPLPIHEDEPPARDHYAHIHDWQVASREERAGRPRVIYRCPLCGALEGRELP